MAWAFVGVGAVATVTTTAHALTLPAGLQAGDLLVAVISSRIASTTSITLPAGWTLVAESKTNNVVAAAVTSEASGMMAYMICGDDPTAIPLTFTHPATPSVAMGRIVAYRGGNVWSPFDVGIGAKTGTSITAVSTTGLTTGQANELIVKGVCSGRAAAFSAHDAVTDPTTSSAAGSVQTAAPIVGTWQERQDASTTTGADTALAIADAIRGTAGATGALTCTSSVSGGHCQVTGAFRIEPVATPGTTTIAQAGSASHFSISSAANSGTVSSTITVPADAQLVAVGVKGWCGEAPFFTNMTFTKGAADTAMTRIGVSELANGHTAAIFYLVLPDTGTNKSLKFDWNGTNAPGEAPVCSVTFWKGIDTASPVRSSGASLAAVAGSQFPTRTSVLTAQDGDLVVCFAGGDNPGADGTIDSWYNCNLLTQCTKSADRHDAAWATFAPSADLYVGAQTATGLNYGVCAAIVLKPGAVSVTGTLATTEAVDVAAMTGTVRRLADLATTEAPDVALINATVRWAATLAETEDPDIAALTGIVRWSATLAETEDADTAAFLGTTSWQATLTTTEAADTALINGTVVSPATGDLATAEAPDVPVFLGAISWQVTLAATEAADAAAFLGAVHWTATLATTEAPDVAALTGVVRWPATLAAVEAPDAPVFLGTTRWAATLATTEAADAASFLGAVFTPVSASLATTEDPDATAATGAVSWIATLATSEAPDTAAFIGSTQWLATLAVTEAADTASFTGAGFIQLSGPLAVIEAPDAAAFVGGIYATGTLATGEAPDTAALTGVVRWSAVLAATEAPDAGAFTGTVRRIVTLAAIEPPDIAALTGNVRWLGTLSASEAPDVAAFTGGIYGSGFLSVREGADSYQGAGLIIGEGLVGFLQTAEAPDTAVFMGAISGGAGTLAVSEAADVGAFSGQSRWVATLAASEAADAVSFLATATSFATLAVVEYPDGAVFTVTSRWLATLATREAPDTALFEKPVPGFGDLATTEAPDGAALSGMLGVLGYLWTVEPEDSAAFTANLVHIHGSLNTREAPDTALITSRPPDIVEVPGRILASKQRRVRELASDERVRTLQGPQPCRDLGRASKRVRSLKYPIPRTHELLKRVDELTGV